MKGCPKSLGHDGYIDAERRDGCRKGFESSPQFRSGPIFSEPQIGRKVVFTAILMMIGGR